MSGITCPYCGKPDQVEVFPSGDMADDVAVSGSAPYTGGILCHTCEKHLPTYKAIMSQDSFDIVYEQLWSDFCEWRESFFELADTNKASDELERRRAILLYLNQQINYARFDVQ